MRNYKTILCATAIFAIALVGGLMIGCSEKSIDSHTAEPDFKVSGVQNEVETDIGKVINPQLRDQVSDIQEDLEEALSITAIQAAMARLGSEFTYAPEYSFVMAGNVVPNGSDDTVYVEVTTLAMTFDADLMERAAYVSYIVAPGIGTTVEVTEASFVTETATDGWERIVYDDGTNVYLRSFISDSKQWVHNKATWDWKGWLKCTAAWAAGSCTASAAGCLALGPAWGPCTAVGCGAGTLGGAVGCAVEQLLT